MIFWLGSLLLLQIARIAFLLRSSPSFEGLGFIDLSKAFAYGLRFDLSALAYLFLASLGVELLLRLLRSKYVTTLTRLFKVLGVTVFFLLALVDVEYFVVSHKRLDASIFSIGGDISDQSLQLIFHYKLISLAVLFTFFVFWHLSGRVSLKGKIHSGGGFFKKAITTLLLIPLAVIFARGGLQEKPIKISSAMGLANSKLITLSLSTPFVMMQTLKKQSKLEVFNDYTKLESAQILRFERPYSIDSSAMYLSRKSTDNVVVVILESFSVEYSSFTPFLESLKRRGLNFENHYANGRTSIEAIPALLAALPSLIPSPYITSPYVNSQLRGLPSVEAESKRDFMFFHGARRGSMYFDSFTRFVGYPYYFAKEDYDGDPSAFYDWGVHDHAFLDFTGKKLSSWKKPFVANVFTLSSHQPFEIPASFSSSLAQAPTPFARSLRYADYSLQLFFEKYASQEWFKNTLFIITGDHTSQCQTSEFCSQLGIHRVPLVLVHGSREIAPQQIKKITQHADIPATIADYLNIDVSALLPFGKSILRRSDKGLALLNSDGEYSVVLEDGYYRLGGSGFLRCKVDTVADKDCLGVIPEQHEPVYKYLKALRSYFTQSLDTRSFE
jgi:phosphoglycerol transferase MdoB-like AlkP superfamily enzyme